MRASRDLNRLRSIFDAADQKFFALPAAVTTARTVHERLLAAESPVPPVNLGAVDTWLVEQMVAEAGKPEPSWPGPGDVLKARAANEAAETWATAHAMAVEAAEQRLVGAVTGRGDQIITECLAPAIEQCLEHARKVSKNFEAVADFGDKQLLAAEAKHRDAALTLDRVSARYNAIRDAQSRLTAGLQNDLDGIFAEVSNLKELYGSRWPGRYQQS